MIRTVDARTDPAWRALMLTPRGSLFGAPPWLSAICDTYGFEMSANLMLDNRGQATGGFAFAEVDDFLGARIFSLPFCDFLDPIVDTDDEWRELVDPIVDRGLPYQIRVINADEPRRDERFVEVDEMAWHATDLLRDEDAIFAAWSRRARQNVRTAQKNHVTTRFGSDLEDVHAYHELHRRTRKHKHRLLAQPVSFFENIWKQFAPDDGIVCGFAEHEGEVIAASMHLMWGGVWYFKFSASVFERSAVRPNELLAWESMRIAKSRGCSYYDWGVSDLDPPGLVDYKRKVTTDERKVSVLRYTPEGFSNPVAAEARPVLGDLTKLLTREDIPDDITQRAGEILYRYFTWPPMAPTPSRTRNLIIVAVVVVLVIGVAGVVVSRNSSSNHGMLSPVPVDGYFKTLPPGAPLPSDAECAARVHRSPWEPRSDNTKQNNTKPKQPVVLADDPAYNDTFQQKYKPRVTGNFTGTTDEIIQWAACKWGLSDNMVRAQAVDESKWHQNTESDPEPRTNGHCAPHDTRNPCPTSFGILQIKWYFHPTKSAVGSSYPMSKTMTAFSLDYTLSEERGCYDGLSFVGEKAKGDLFGCMGVWYAGEWRNAAAEEYIARVKKDLNDKAWLKWRGQVSS